MKKVLEGAKAASVAAEKQVQSFIDKFDPKNQALIRAVRAFRVDSPQHRERDLCVIPQRRQPGRAAPQNHDYELRSEFSRETA